MTRAPSPRGRRTAAIGLALLGLLAIATPYADGLVGVEVPVAARVEIVDHVLPGALVAVAGLFDATRSTGAAEPSDGGVLLAALAGAFLAGLWMTSSHVPLLLDAADDKVAWDGALFHAAVGPPLALLALLLVAIELRGSDRS